MGGRSFKGNYTKCFELVKEKCKLPFGKCYKLIKRFKA